MNVDNQPVLEETFCNHEDIPFEPFNGRLADLGPML
jgi:hypothetical protein